MAYRKKTSKKSGYKRSAKPKRKAPRKAAGRSKRPASRRTQSIQRIQIVMPGETAGQKPYPSLTAKKEGVLICALHTILMLSCQNKCAYLAGHSTGSTSRVNRGKSRQSLLHLLYRARL